MPDLVTRIFGEIPTLRDEDLLSRDQPLEPVPPIHRWRYNAGLRALAFVAGFVGLSALAGLIAGLVLAAMGGSLDEISQQTQSLSSLLTIPVAILCYLLLAKWMEQRNPTFEFGRRKLVSMLLLGLALGVVLQLVCVGILALVGAYRVEGFDPSYNPWPMIMGAGFSAAIVEEILFRGVLYRLAEDTFGTWIAIVISGLVFGLVHLKNDQATLQGALAIALEAGILFAVLYAMTRSLWLVMGLHFAWNVVQGPVLGIVVSGSSASGSGLVRSTLEGPEWLAGGPFGMEASLVTIVVLVALAAVLLVRLARSGQIVQPTWVRKRRLVARNAASGVSADGPAAPLDEPVAPPVPPRRAD